MQIGRRRRATGERRCTHDQRGSEGRAMARFVCCELLSFASP